MENSLTRLNERIESLIKANYNDVSSRVALMAFQKEIEVELSSIKVAGETPTLEDDSKITRLEVIDGNGRAYTNYNCSIELSRQDNNRTLKIFVAPPTLQGDK